MNAFVIFLLCVAFTIAILANLMDPVLNYNLAIRGKTNKQIRESMERGTYILDDQGNKVLDENGRPRMRYVNISDKMFSWCTGDCFYYSFVYPLSKFISFVIIPILAIADIVNRTSNIYLAAAVLLITIISLATSIVTLTNIKKGVAQGIQSAEDEENEKEETFPEPTADDRITLDAMLSYQKRKNAWKKQQEMNKTAKEEARQQIEDPKIPITNWGAFTSIVRRVFFALPALYLLYVIVLALAPK